MIRKRGEKYQLVSHEGKVLGTHASREAAARQERAIKASEHKRGKKK